MRSVRSDMTGTILVFLLSIIAMPTILHAQDSRPIFYQGRLLNSSGVPVDDGFFGITFSLYQEAEGGGPLWTELHQQVPTSNGNFAVRLGSITPIPLDLLQIVSLYLQIQVTGDDPMVPRIAMADIPRGSISRRLVGDINTEQSTIRIHPPDPGLHIGIAAAALNDSDFVHLYPIHPPEPGLGPIMSLSSSAVGAHMIIDDNMPGDEGSGFRVSTTDEGAVMIIDDNMPTGESFAIQGLVGSLGANMIIDDNRPTGERAAVEISSNGAGAHMIIDDNRPTGEGATVELSSNSAGAHMIIDDNMPTGAADMTIMHTSMGGGENAKVMIGAAAAGANFDMFPPQEMGSEPVMSMNSNADGSWNWLMFNPQPEPPARPISEMSTGVDGSFNWLMFNPQPEPPAAIMNMGTNAAGPSFEMTSPQFGGAGLSLSKPVWQMTADDLGGKLNLYNPVIGADVPPVVAINSSVGGDAGMYMFNPQPEPPADGNPWLAMTTGVGTGASLVMFNPQPEPPAFPFLEMNANAQGPSFRMTAVQAVGGRLEITNPIIEMKADSTNGQITLQKSFLSPTGGPDRTRIQLYSDSLQARIDMLAPASSGTFAVRMTADANGGMIGVNTSPTNVITVQRNSITDPIADAWTTYSSRRWKTNIATIENSLAKVMSLRGVTYDWKDNGRHDYGLIAEEVGEVLPELVTYEEDGVDARSLDYTRLVPILIEATKTQQRMIEELKSEIETLKSQVENNSSGTVKSDFTSADK